jgi:hypothetical protein
MARRKSSKVAKTIDAAGEKLAEVPGISPNPMTNLLLTDLVLRGGGQIMRHAVERTLLGTKYPKDKAKNIVKGRSMVQTIVGTALARIATRSVPGAIIVGGGCSPRRSTIASRARPLPRPRARARCASRPPRVKRKPIRS